MPPKEQLSPKPSTPEPAASSRLSPESAKGPSPLSERQVNTSTPSSPRIGPAGSTDKADRPQASRKSSIKFAQPTPDKTPSPDGSGSSDNVTGMPKPRLPSPPPPSPPPKFGKRVGFNLSEEENSLILTEQHRDYVQERDGSEKKQKTYLCGTDESDHAGFALQYTIDNLVDAGDTIVCVRVVDKKSETGKNLESGVLEYQKEALKLDKRIKEMLQSDNAPAVRIHIEVALGKVGDTLDRLVHIHNPVCLIVGTRGKSLAASKLGKNSVSNYLYLYSPVPVVIVRPPQKRHKKYRKRQKDPERQAYKKLLEKDEATDHETGQSSKGTALKTPEDESKAVAKALGLSADFSVQEVLDRRTRSQASSRERHTQRRLDGSREDSEEEDDNADGAPLTRMGTKYKEPTPGQELDINIIDEYGTTVEAQRFNTMPNYRPGLGQDEVAGGPAKHSGGSRVRKMSALEETQEWMKAYDAKHMR